MKSNPRSAVVCGKTSGQFWIKCLDAINDFVDYLLLTFNKGMIQFWRPIKLSLGFQEWPKDFHNPCLGEGIRALLNQTKPTSDACNIGWFWKFPNCSDSVATY